MHIKLKVCTLFALFLALAVGTGEVQAQIIAGTATLSIDTLSVNVPVIQVGKLFLTNNGQPFTLTSANTLERITLSGTANPDPFLSYSVSATNGDTATHTFTFSFVQAVVPQPAGTLVRHTLSGSLTAGDSGVTISPSAFVGIARGSINGVGIPALDVGTAQTSPTGTTPYPPSGIFSAQTVSAVPITSLDVNGSFTLTGGGDQAALSGLLTTVVPEPSSLAMGSCSLLVGLMVAARKRHRAASRRA